MDITDENLQTLANYLVQTLSPDPNIRRPAERFLESVEINKNYPILLLRLINKADAPPTIRVAGAISFKNYVKRNWPINADTGERKIDEGDRAAVKELIVDVMLASPGNVQKQLSEAVGTIGKYDFPKEWPSLLTSMVDKFISGDFHVINGILQTAHSIFKRYRYEFKSQQLWEEIKFVLDTFAKPLTDLAVATQGLAETHSQNPEALRTIYSSLLLISKIFYSLNFQDLPEFFEDNMHIWMPLFHTWLTVEVKSLQTDDESEAGIMEQLRSQICSNVSLYVQKYDEEMQPYLSGFVTDIWNLLVTVSLQPKNDMLVSNALQFLSTVADRRQHQQLFEDKNTLTGICEKVIIPNIHFRDAELELFEDNAEEYMRRDMEGSDVESRRRSASDLVKVLAGVFPETVRSIFGTSVQQMLAEYTNDSSKWRLKNTAVYIVTSLAERGSTAKHGVTKASDLVELSDFAARYIIPELEKEVNTLPVIKADSIKYLITFRSILPPEQLVRSFPLIIKHLSSPSQVVHSYASIGVDKLLLVRHAGQPVITDSMLAPYAGQLLNGLFNIFTIEGSEENEYAMKGVMRTFTILGPYVVPYLSELLPKLTEKLAAVARNPSKPHFNHYLFETISVSIRIVCKDNPSAVEAFEITLFPIFQYIFQADVQEFAPYCMQVLSLMLSNRRTGGLPEAYVALYPSLLTPQLWERAGCIRGLVCLLQAYIKVASHQDYANTLKVSGLLGVFQKLVSSRLNDHEGFNLIQSLVEYCPREFLGEYMKQVVLLLFQRLTTSRTTKFVKCLIVFFSLVVCKYSALTFIDLVDSIQPQMFGMVVERVIIPDCKKVADSIERKITVVGLSRLLADAKQVFAGPYSSLWGGLAKCVVEMLELPSEEPNDDGEVEIEEISGYDAAYVQLSALGRNDHDPIPEPNDDGEVEIEEISGYDAAYVQLSALGRNDHDPIPEVKDVRAEFARCLKDIYCLNENMFRQAVLNLGDPYTSQVKTYLSAVNVAL